MAKLIFGMNQSLDGFVDHDRFSPDPVLFRHFTEQMRRTAGSIYGRTLYELMAYWDQDDWDSNETASAADLRDFAVAWRAQPKWVVSSSLESVGPNATLITGDLESAVREIKDQASGDLEVGGPTLAHGLAQLGLIDEYQIYLNTALLGHGRPFFAEPFPRLRLTGSEHIGEAIRLTYVPE